MKSDTKFGRRREGVMPREIGRFFPPARGLLMPLPTPVPLRQAVWQRQQGQQPTTVIAQDLGLPLRTIRRLRQRFRDHGSAALPPSYDACGRPRTQAYQALHDEAVALRKEHPTWGAGLLRVFLRRHHPRATLPSERTL